MNDGGLAIRSRFKKEVGKTITVEQYTEWNAAKVKIGQLNKYAKSDTRKKVMATEAQLRQGLMDRVPVLEQVCAFIGGANDSVVGIANAQAVQTDMLGYPNKGHPGKGTEGGVNTFFPF